jgi:PPOX class probable F420-dependent enzyme
MRTISACKLLPSKTRSRSVTRQTALPLATLAVLGLLAHGCAWFSHHRTQASSPSHSHAPPHQIATIPPEFLDLVTTKKAFALLATVMPNGSPQVTPVWFDYDGKYIRVNSARGRVKDKNMRRDPRVALSILDPDNPYRYLTIRGRVVKITEDGAVEHINALAKKYRGVETYRSRSPGEVRVIYVIEARRVSGQG